MAESDKVQLEPFSYYLWCGAVFPILFFLLLCPEFVQAAFKGRLELSLIPKGAQWRLEEAKQLLQGRVLANTGAVNQLFGEVGRLGPGAIAIGNAEGTLNADGTPNWLYYGHPDPANHLINMGFGSWQASLVKNVEEADQKAMDRIKTECVPYTIKTFAEQGLALTPRLLVESCDIWIQAPRAAVDFAWNLKNCQQQGTIGDDAILCARLKNYSDPATGEFEVAAIFRQPGALEADQRRRMGEIADTLMRFRVPEWLPLRR
ncbi:MAG: hypothetical protein HC866_00185 [Leptolyngbyaceae cyanobacterium RU_5_1]|nr:hypothetical protein [Leptolyngbyaceae cyanobacterium RU_5_1]